MRSRSKWLREGEAPTKYFFSLAKAKFSRDRIHGLQLSNGEVVTRRKDILKVVEEYYSELYNSEGESLENHLARQEILHLINRRISESEAARLNEIPTDEEVDNTIKSLKRDLNPDTFTVEGRPAGAAAKSTTPRSTASSNTNDNDFTEVKSRKGKRATSEPTTPASEPLDINMFDVLGNPQGDQKDGKSDTNQDGSPSTVSGSISPSTRIQDTPNLGKEVTPRSGNPTTEDLIERLPSPTMNTSSSPKTLVPFHVSALDPRVQSVGSHESSLGNWADVTNEDLILSEARGSKGRAEENLEHMVPPDRGECK
ncbi:hypothetical protein R1sor_021563 [Riccia sorocarpa]|uniref:Uncharacterized protein n=1 Tax=Riccia sorocarpa TaxID=122646 RepID=A0ABD3GKD3_9MARC